MDKSGRLAWVSVPTSCLYPYLSTTIKYLMATMSVMDDFTEPDVSPSVNLLPAWNRMVLFGVCPGISFHSVQEVYENMDHRLSISGWFHSDVEPDAMQNASLRQLKLKEGSDTNRTFVDIACNTSGVIV